MNKAADRLNATPQVRYDLKDCPFCGHSPEIQFWHGGKPTKRLICCGNNECEVSPSVTGETEREAVARWERRAP
jgi:hypothetical protein